MNRPSPLSIALALFQMKAEEMAARFGVLDVETHTSTGTEGTTYYCIYQLTPTSEQLEAPPAVSPSDAVLNLEDALRQMSPELFSSN